MLLPVQVDTRKNAGGVGAANKPDLECGTRMASDKSEGPKRIIGMTLACRAQLMCSTANDLRLSKPH